MRTSAKDTHELKDYEEPLSSLEAAFRAAKTPLKFFLFVAPLNNKMVQITCKGRQMKLVCIEGCSPAQAVQAVAAAVGL